MNLFTRRNFFIPTAAVLIYALLRVLYHIAVEGAGLVEQGPISYDSYYMFTFARELAREGNWFFFHNPFGSFDQSPRLFNLGATFLGFLKPLFQGHLLALDIVASSAALFISMFAFSAILIELPLPLLALISFAGGTTFIISHLLSMNPSEAVNLIGFWGVTPLSNWIATPEIIYNAIFLIGLWSAFQRRFAIANLIAIFLWALHPFTASIFSFALAATYHHAFYYQKLKVRIYALSLFLIAAVAILLWTRLLPSYSRDAAYFKFVYEQVEDKIPVWMYVATFSIPIVMTGFLILQREGRKTFFEILKKDQRVFTFLATAGLCITASNAYAVFDIHIVQPAHWSRFYPLTFFISALAIITVRIGAWNEKNNRIFICALLVIGLSDSLLALNDTAKTLISDAVNQGGSPPAIDSHDLHHLIEAIPNNAQGGFAYFTACDGKLPPGSLEYAVMSETNLVAPFGHLVFSPNLEKLLPRFRLCDNFSGGDLSPLKLLTQKFAYVAVDTSVRARLPLEGFVKVFSSQSLELFKRQ